MNLKILIFTACIMAGISTQAQKITITGQLNHVVKDGLLHLVNTERAIDIAIKTNANNSFYIKIPALKAGFYNLTEVGMVYLKPGFNLKINNESDSTYSFSGKGSVENNILSEVKQKGSKILPINKETTALSWKLLNDPIDSFLVAVKTYNYEVKQSVALSKDIFFQNLLKGDADSYARNLMPLLKITYGWDSAGFEIYSNLKKTLKKTDPFYANKLRRAGFMMIKKILRFADEKRLDSLYQSGFDWNNEVLFYNSEKYRDALIGETDNLSKEQTPTNNPSLNALSIADQKITSPIIKAHVKSVFGIAFMKAAKNKAQIDSVYHVLLLLPLTETDKEKVSNEYNNINQLKNDPSSLNFIYPDVDGKEVSLKSLRGKYVYIDVWATWCVPCLAEMPSLKKIEEAYHDKNIQFVGLSVDKQAEKKKWQQMVKSMRLAGIQVIADKDFSSAFIEAFQINSIPRFILIDPKGAIISADAFRPSDPKLKQQLDKLL